MSKHLKRLASPRSWSIHKKERKWTVRPSPGPHPLRRAVPLLILVRDMLSLCDTGREGRRIIGRGEILVDGKSAKDYKRGVGFMDVVEIPKTKQFFRILLDDRGKITATSITEDRAFWKFVRIENKKTIKGGKIQLNLHDGRNILTDSKEYKTGDVLKIELPTQKIVERFPMDDGYVAMIVGGKHAGEMSHILSTEITKSSMPNIVHFREGISTIKDYVFVVGAREPEIIVPGRSAI